jgi:hypothetical protein
MTYDEARQEAKRRWGAAGRARHQLKSDLFKVGKQVGSVFLVKGVGRSWEEAFQSADQNKQQRP